MKNMVTSSCRLQKRPEAQALICDQLIFYQIKLLRHLLQGRETDKMNRHNWHQFEFLTSRGIRKAKSNSTMNTERHLACAGRVTHTKLGSTRC
jgi:hypothetical protein